MKTLSQKIFENFTGTTKIEQEYKSLKSKLSGTDAVSGLEEAYKDAKYILSLIESEIKKSKTYRKSDLDKLYDHVEFSQQTGKFMLWIHPWDSAIYEMAKSVVKQLESKMESIDATIIIDNMKSVNVEFIY